MARLRNCDAAKLPAHAHMAKCLLYGAFQITREFTYGIFMRI